MKMRVDSCLAATWLKAGLLVCIRVHACWDLMELELLVWGSGRIDRLQDLGYTKAKP
jgi:hypothetical protein